VKYCGAKLSLQIGGPANYDSVGMHLLILYAAACGSRSALREKADEARGIDADYEQEPRRIDGINFQPLSDTRRGDGRKSRLKHVECGRRALPLPLRPSPIALLTGAPKATNRSVTGCRSRIPVRAEICRTRPGRLMRSGPYTRFVAD
jgi:hypothetical protein